MYKYREISRCEVRTISVFVDEIVNAAAQPRDKRGNLDYVVVKGEVKPLSFLGEQDHSYEFIGSFPAAIRGQDNEFQDIFFYRTTGVYRGDYNAKKDEIISDNLSYLELLVKHRLVRVGYPELPIRIEENQLVVNSMFAHVEDICKIP